MRVFICFTYCFPGDSIYERSVGFLVKDQLAKAKIAKLKTEKAKKEQEVQGQSKAKIKAGCAMHSTKSVNQCFTFEVISKDPNKLFNSGLVFGIVKSRALGEFGSTC